MKVDIKAIGDDVSVEVAQQMMHWMHIHHLPVEDREKNLLGIISWDDLASHHPDTPY